MSKSKFDYMLFHGGYDGDELVIHAKKYTKEQAIELFLQEYGKSETKYRTPTIEDIEDNDVRYYPTTPDYLTHDVGNDGCYTYCFPSKGSFPVYVLRPNEFKID